MSLPYDSLYFVITKSFLRKLIQIWFDIRYLATRYLGLKSHVAGASAALAKFWQVVRLYFFNFSKLIE